MQCDSCKHQVIFRKEDEKIHCSMGHWFCLGDPETDKDQTLWDNCEDFEVIIKELNGKACVL